MTHDHDNDGCDALRRQLDAYLEGELSPEERARTERHLATCAECSALVAELRAIIARAATLPPLEPSRDLWAGIAARIRTPIIPVGSTPVRTRTVRRWPLAAAAAALVALSAGTTWLLTSRGAGGAPTVSPTVASRPAVAQSDTIVTAVPEATPLATPAAPRAVPGSLASTRRNASATRVYDREITLLDSVVRTRRDVLDPKTVAIVERNLRIIDSAITESRAALARDPNSALLTDRLNNVLGSKVDLLRTVAFIPSRT
jgi:anti-sigma factor RsiW